ncbi:DUF3265 domain-containing protein [Aeromonas jandaei]|nr:DUF3265 domain-containing protein [Aeromonas jandaei]
MSVNIATSCKCHLKNYSGGIRNAWDFYHALVQVIKVVCGSFGIVLLIP